MARGKTIAMVFAACAAFGLLLIGSCAALLYLGFKNTDAAVSPRIDAMFAAIQNHTFAETYDTQTTQELRNATTKQQYEALGNVIAVRLGALKSKSLRGFNLRQFNADSYADVTYAATFEKGSGTICAKLKRQGGQWKFVTFHVDSPMFTQDLATATCPSCGAPHSASARFCPSCGAKLASGDANESSPGPTSVEKPATEQPDAAEPKSNKTLNPAGNKPAS